MTDWPIVWLTAVLVLITGYYAWQNKRMVEELRKQRRETIRLQQYERGPRFSGVFFGVSAWSFETAG